MAVLTTVRRWMRMAGMCEVGFVCEGMLWRGGVAVGVELGVARWSVLCRQLGDVERCDRNLR